MFLGWIAKHYEEDDQFEFFDQEPPSWYRIVIPIAYLPIKDKAS